MNSDLKRPVVAVAALCLALFLWFGFNKVNQKPPTPAVTQQEFSRIEKGMTYEECVAIIEAEGTPYGSSGMPGEEGEDVDWLSYQWNNPDGSYVEISFFQNRVDTFRSNLLK
jgi:hypothetical protein